MMISRCEIEQYKEIGAGKGTQGKIYQVSDDMVAKVLDGEMNIALLTTMKELPLKHFVKPVEEVYDEEECYSMAYPYIPSDDYQSAITLSKKEILQNIKTLIEDIQILSEARILIRDFIPKNTLLFEKKIYVVDFDLYVFANPKMDEETLLKVNMAKLDQYFHNLWTLALVNFGMDRQELKYHPEYFEEDYLDSIANDMQEEETIVNFIKRKRTM